MTQQRTEYADTCELHNTDHDRTITAEVLKFVPEKILEVSVQRSVKIVLRWQITPSGAGLYVGSMAGREFTSDGPESVTYRLSR